VAKPDIPVKSAAEAAARETPPTAVTDRPRPSITLFQVNVNSRRRHHQMAARTGVSLMALALAATGACGDGRSPTAPSRLSQLTLAGPTALTDVGSTGRLTATARFSDDSERDVSADAAWSSSDSRIVSVAPGGVITAAGFGIATIDATFQRRASTQVFVIRAGKSYSTGRVTEAGGGPIAGVRVLDTSRAWLGTTDSSGWYLAAGFSGSSMLFEHDLYESAARTIVPNSMNHVAMQKVIRLTAGASLAGELMAFDAGYDLGNLQCEPCRLIRIQCASAGRLELQLSWTQTQPMGLWTSGELFSRGERAVVSVSAGELVVYVGHIPPRAIGWELADFTLATRLIPVSQAAVAGTGRN
jgi:hypothetical protein